MDNSKMIRQYATVPSLAECSRRIAEIRAKILLAEAEAYGEPTPELTPEPEPQQPEPEESNPTREDGTDECHPS